MEIARVSWYGKVNQVVLVDISSDGCLVYLMDVIKEQRRKGMHVVGNFAAQFVDVNMRIFELDKDMGRRDEDGTIKQEV